MTTTKVQPKVLAFDTALAISEEIAPSGICLIEKNQLTLTIVRGVPGSGKSTLAKHMIDDYAKSVVVENDQFFTFGEDYVWDEEFRLQANANTKLRAMLALGQGYNVVVANTNINPSQCQSILEVIASKRYNICQVRVVTLLTSHQNIHDVPDEDVQEMKERFTPHDKFVEYVCDYLRSADIRLYAHAGYVMKEGSNLEVRDIDLSKYYEVPQNEKTLIRSFAGTAL